MASKKRQSPAQSAAPAPGRDYRHSERALMRPEAGAQQNFRAAKPSAKRRYDSSLAPELRWDESATRAECDAALARLMQSLDLAAAAIGGGGADLAVARAQAESLRKMSAPFLNWAGKAERGSLDIPTLPLFTHERLSTAAILDTLEKRYRARTETLDLFNEGAKSIGEKIGGAYKHRNGWQNRLILGDSLQVMNSLLEYEGLGGQVQMVYMDPPYGIKFGSNFQPFVRRRDVDDGDASMTREPEMVQAYRDAWELGVHSWLAYMRDRLLLARELLTDSGSCFVQISEENVHLVRNIMDEVFGRENFVSMIAYKTTSGVKQKSAPRRICDYIVWHAKDAERMKFNRLYVKNEIDPKMFRMVEDAKGNRRPMTAEEKRDIDKLDEGLRPFRTLPLHSRGAGNNEPREFEGENYTIPQNRHWSHTMEGFNRLAKGKRIVKEKTVISSIRYFDDFPHKELSAYWDDTGPELHNDYIVQTSPKPIERCMLMVTDPGDLVFDPTCGSGTTAYVAENQGRRWITTDVSRVPLALARQRLLTAIFPYYALRGESPSGGFVYKRRQNKKGEEVGGIVPNVTLKSIANDEEPAMELLVDKPEETSRTKRICGPFCVESVMPPALSPEELAAVDAEAAAAGKPNPLLQDSDGHCDRMTEILRLSPVLRLPGNQSVALKNISPAGKSVNLHAKAESDGGDKIAIAFGPANAPIHEAAVIAAANEARNKGYGLLLVVAFAIAPGARQTIADAETLLGIKAQYAQAAADLAMADLLKNTRASEIFAVCGLPDVDVRPTGEKTAEGLALYEVELRGVDAFDPTAEPDAQLGNLPGNDAPCWMLDAGYDGQCFRAGQVFFPRAKEWDKLKAALRAEFDDAVWAHLAGVISAPFVAGETGKIAVKVIDLRGNELMVVKELPAA